MFPALGIPRGNASALPTGAGPSCYEAGRLDASRSLNHRSTTVNAAASSANSSTCSATSAAARRRSPSTESRSNTSSTCHLLRLVRIAGFYAPTLFDNYSAFKPAAGGDVRDAGGAQAGAVDRHRARRRLPRVGRRRADRAFRRPYLPPGLRLDPMEGAGEVQTPLLGEPARALRVGDRVYFRHTKAGELCERFNSPVSGVRATRSSTRCRPTAARAAASCS